MSERRSATEPFGGETRRPLGDLSGGDLSIELGSGCRCCCCCCCCGVRAADVGVLEPPRSRLDGLPGGDAAFDLEGVDEASIVTPLGRGVGLVNSSLVHSLSAENSPLNEMCACSTSPLRINERTRPLIIIS